MSLSIYNNDRLIESVAEWSDRPKRLEFEIELPAMLIFKTDGKHVYDTLVDEQGNILSDKYIKVDGLCFDGVWIKKWMLESEIFDFVANDGSHSRSNYFGRNGQGKIDIPYSDALDFWLEIMSVDQ